MATLASDNFDRDNSADLGAVWDNPFGESQFKILSNVATPSNLSADCSENNTSVTWPDDQWSQAKISVTGGSAGDYAGVGVSVRCDTTGDRTYYRCVVNKAASNNVALDRFIDGSHVGIALRTTTWVDGDVLRLEVEGTTLRIYQNGTQLGADVTNGADEIASGRPGIAYSSTVTAASVNDWAGGDFSAAGGTQFTLGLAGTVTPVGVLTRATARRFTATVTPAGTLLRATSKTLTGTLTPTGLLRRATTRVFAGTVTPAGTLARQVSTWLAGTVTPVGAPLTWAIAKGLTGTVTPVGTLTKATATSFTGTVTPVGDCAIVKVALLAVAGVVTPVGTMVLSAMKALAGTVTPAGTLARATARAFSGTVTPVGTLAKQTAKPLAGTVTPAGDVSLIKVALLALNGAVTPVGVIVVQAGKALAGTVTAAGTLTWAVAKVLAGTVTPTGRLGKAVGRLLTGTVTPAGEATPTLIPGGSAPATRNDSWRRLWPL